jgi:hypothetical protein
MIKTSYTWWINKRRVKGRASDCLQIHSIGHGVITFCRSQAIRLPTRQKAYAKMGRRIEGKQKEEYPHNIDPFCKID